MFGTRNDAEVKAYNSARIPLTETMKRVKDKIGVTNPTELERFCDFAYDYTHVQVSPSNTPEFFEKLDKAIGLTKRKRDSTCGGAITMSNEVVHVGIYGKTNTAGNTRFFDPINFWTAVFIISRDMLFGLEDHDHIPPFARVMISRMPDTIGSVLVNEHMPHFREIIPLSIFGVNVTKTSSITQLALQPNDNEETLFLFLMMVTTFFGFDTKQTTQLYHAIIREGRGFVSEDILWYYDVVKRFLTTGEDSVNLRLENILAGARVRHIKQAERRKKYYFDSHVKFDDRARDANALIIVPCKRFLSTIYTLDNDLLYFCGCEEYQFQREFSYRCYDGELRVALKPASVPIAILRAFFIAFRSMDDKVREKISICQVFASFICYALSVIETLEEEAVEGQPVYAGYDFELAGCGLALATRIFASTLLKSPIKLTKNRSVYASAIMNWARLLKVLPWAIYTCFCERDDEKDAQMANCDIEYISEFSLMRIDAIEKESEREDALHTFLFHFIIYATGAASSKGEYATNEIAHFGFLKTDMEAIGSLVDEHADFERYAELRNAVEMFNYRVLLGEPMGDFLIADNIVHAQMIDFIISAPPMVGGSILGKMMSVLDVNNYHAKKPLKTTATEFPRMETHYNTDNFSKLIGRVVAQVNSHVHGAPFLNTTQPVPCDPLQTHVFIGNEFYPLSKCFPAVVPVNTGKSECSIFMSRTADELFCRTRNRISIDFALAPENEDNGAGRDNAIANANANVNAVVHEDVIADANNIAFIMGEDQ